MKHASLGGLDVFRVGLGAMTAVGVYTTGGGSMTPSRSAPSTVR